MGEKLYRPIIKDGDHLVSSTQNPDRFRGLTRDCNNKNQDIIEWEEVETSDYQYEEYGGEPRVQLTPQEQKMAEEIGVALAAASVCFFSAVVVPWWKSTAWPWLVNKGKDVKSRFTKKEMVSSPNITDIKKKNAPMGLDSVSEQIDIAFEHFYFDMDKEEAYQHILNIIYHMLGLANEIRIMSNARIREENEENYIELQNATKEYLTRKVATSIDKILSDERLSLDMNTSKCLFSLLGGGININGEYAPVDIEMVGNAVVKVRKGG